jgi:hypothetical protein
VAIDFDLVPSQPFHITLPTSATVNDAGGVVVSLASIAFTMKSANTSATFGTVTLGARRV